ncbi:hypothetical protein [Enterococcus sp. DIV0806c]|uniref:hypothetical protein n=1 Tax=unclassified Enterococcus TaxID=2608891 RepID=UPI003F270457
MLDYSKEPVNVYFLINMKSFYKKRLLQLIIQYKCYLYKNGLKLYLNKSTVRLVNSDKYTDWSILIIVLLKLYEKTQDIIWRNLLGLICLIYSYFEPLMTKVTRFLGIEHTCKRISLLTAVSLIYQAIPIVPTVFDDWI